MFKNETEEYNRIVQIFINVDSPIELNRILLKEFERLGISKPWKGDFDEHMSNKAGTLVFE